MNIFDVFPKRLAEDRIRNTRDMEYIESQLKIYPNDRILHAGCGPGVHAIYIAKKHPICSVYGYDTSNRMLEIARSRADDEGLANIYFENKDVTNLSPSEKFDAIIADRLFMWFRNPEVRRDLRQSLYRTLDRRGTLIVSEPIPRNSWDDVMTYLRGYTFGSKDAMVFFFNSETPWTYLNAVEKPEYSRRYFIGRK
ncbi:MAG: class I SAM-dependent methyltransferase [Candidatus Aenigmarchaeota archaeon]|nr:class I SAM-dependent methyltransferase [Candidatus Aenigmarchaeota archaeon]